MQLHGSFQDLQKGDASVAMYMQQEKSLFDELVAASDQSLLKISTSMCFVAFIMSLKTW
jgi:hypothetical protein